MTYQGISSFTPEEPLILNSGDWPPDEWNTICRALGIPNSESENAKQIRCDEVSFSVLLCDDCDSARIITLNCPTCGHKCFIQWDTKRSGLEIHCPRCGNPIMLKEKKNTIYHTDYFKVKNIQTFEELLVQLDCDLELLKADNHVAVNFLQPLPDVECFVHQLQEHIAENDIAVLLSNVTHNFHVEVILVTSKEYDKFIASADDGVRERQIRNHRLWKAKEGE